jgi:hypothetical protein
MPRAEPGNPSSPPDRMLGASFFRPGRRQRPEHLFETRPLRHHRPPTPRPPRHPFLTRHPGTRCRRSGQKNFFSRPWPSPRDARSLTYPYRPHSRLQSLILSAQNGFYDDARAVKFDS